MVVASEDVSILVAGELAMFILFYLVQAFWDALDTPIIGILALRILMESS
jgi:hypothetical protein